MFNKSILFLAVVVVVGFTVPSFAREAAPIPYRSAPLIPWAKKVDEHRFRSPRNYDRTLEYYRKTILGAAHIVTEKIINTSAVRATHIRNKKAGARWEGMNIYEYKGSTFIFVVFSDKELERDFYSAYVLETTDDPLLCVPTICAERFRVTITITRPPAGQDFELCASDSACAAQNCTPADSIELTWDGACGPNDDRMIYFSVRSPDSDSFDCHEYELQIDAETWLVDGTTWPGCPGAGKPASEKRK